MSRWEYARLESTERGINVVFTHRQAWTGLAPEVFFQTLGQLGDEGWELVAALPLTATATIERAPERAVRDPNERAGAPPAPAAPATQRAMLQLTPDRWLVFKREVPEPPPGETSSAGADLIKGVVGRQLLKGRLPIP